MSNGARSAGLDAARITDDLRRRVFRLDGDPRPLRIGLEVEMMPRAASTGRPLLLERAPASGPGDALSILDLVRDTGRALGWAGPTRGEASPVFRVPGGGKISFEPGGQIEYSTPALHSVDAVIADAGAVLAPLLDRARRSGVLLVTRGIDPSLPLDAVPLQLSGERYRRLACHFADPSGSGRRMMLQTAAIHVSLDFGEEPERRWRAANALVPYFTDVFANSSRYAGDRTGFRSYRAEQWRTLDPSRTGVFPGLDPVGEYLPFSLDAEAILMGEEGEAPRPFREWMSEATEEDWRAHLSTLFPEVRPRGHLEIRAFDALPPHWYAAPIVFATGLLYDAEALATVLEILPVPEGGAPASPAPEGLNDPERAAVAKTLFSLALEGAARLGERIGGGALETARAFHARYTTRGLDPAGDDACAFAEAPDQANAGRTSTAPSLST